MYLQKAFIFYVRDISWILLYNLEGINIVSREYDVFDWAWSKVANTPFTTAEKLYLVLRLILLVLFQT